jgi:hypothetical protein
MMPDFPAAHSMDTDWFAIDADGNIGIFDSGEGGAVPVLDDFNPGQSFWRDGIDNLFVTMTRNLPNRILALKNPSKNLSEFLTSNEFQEDINYPSYLVNDSGSRSFNDESTSLRTTMYGCFLLLSSEEVFPELEIDSIDNAYGLHFIGGNTIVFINKCYYHILYKLIDERKILAGKLSDIDSHMNLLGFFHYSSCSHTPSPYELIDNPIYPLTLSDIHDDIHPLINKINFGGLKFPEINSIQPIEHMKCNTWDTERWIDVEGQEHDRHPTYD